MDASAHVYPEEGVMTTSRIPGRVVVLLAALFVLPGFRVSAETAGSFPVGTDASAVNLSGAPGAIPYEEGWAIPLRGSRPSWFSAALEQEVLAAGGMPVAAPMDAPLPSEVGIRPGAWMIAPYGCT